MSSNSFKVVALISALLTTTSCENDIKKGGNGLRNEDSPKYIVVVCDFSRSVNKEDKNSASTRTSCITYIKDGCSRLMQTLPGKSTIQFFAVSENATIQPFYSFTARKLTQRTKSEERTRVKSAAEEIKKVIDSMSEMPEPTSCILTSIERTYPLFSKLKSEDYPQKELILFTDLLEDCGTSSAGKISIKGSDNQNIEEGKYFDMLKEYQHYCLFQLLLCM